MNSKRRKKNAKRVAPQKTAFRKSRLLLFIGFVAAVALLGFQFATNRKKVPRPKLPDQIEQLDAEVVALIKSQFAKIDADPHNPDVYGQLGLVYEANELWHDANAVFSLAVELAPDNRFFRLHLAIAAHETGDFETEQHEIKRLVERYPDFAAAQHRYGQQMLESGKLAEAEAAFQTVNQQRPKACEGFVGLADVRLRQNKPAEAAKLLEQAIQIDKEYQVAHFLLGNAYSQMGRQNEAGRHLSLGVGGKFRYLADNLSREGERYAVNLNSQITNGVQLMVDGKQQQAASIFEKVLKSDPNNVTVLNNLAGIYFQAKRPNDAHTMLVKALSIDPHKYTTYVNLANWAASKGDLDEALQFADQAVERGPRVEMTHRARASVLFQMNRLKEGLASAETALMLNPQDIRIREQCADFCFRLKDFRKAGDHYRRILQLNPRRANAWIGLTRVYGAVGSLKEARQTLNQAKKLAPNNRIVRLLDERIPK